MGQSSPRWTLLIALLASVAIHLGAVAVVIAAPNQADGNLELSPPTPPEPNDEDEVTLGIEDSEAVTLNWIGYDEYLKHLARPADVDQAAMSPEPTAPAPPVDQVAPSPTPAPTASADAPDSSEVEETPRAQPTYTAADVIDDPEAEIIEQTPETKIEDKVVEATDDATPSEDAEAQPLEAKQVEQPTEAPEARQENDEQAPPTQSQQTPAQQPQEASQNKPPTEPANPADKESQAFSIEKAPVAQPGRPLAAQGLNIRTTVPRWTHFTQMTSRPRDPVVEIYFNRIGRVHKVIVVRDTGRSDVTEPLLDAIYNWTATGKKLRELPPDVKGKEPQTLMVVLRISLSN